MFSAYLLGEGGSSSALIGLIGLLSSEGLIRDMPSDELVDEHAERKYVHLFRIYLCECVCVGRGSKGGRVRCVCVLCVEGEG